jgi:hypothetical protein
VGIIINSGEMYFGSVSRAWEFILPNRLSAFLPPSMARESGYQRQITIRSLDTGLEEITLEETTSEGTTP